MDRLTIGYTLLALLLAGTAGGAMRLWHDSGSKRHRRRIRAAEKRYRNLSRLRGLKHQTPEKRQTRRGVSETS